MISYATAARLTKRLQSDCVELKLGGLLQAADVITNLQSDCVELKWWFVFLTDLWHFLQSDCVELK